jgi:hypothetical protein
LEEAQECIDDPDGIGRRRATAFKSSLRPITTVVAPISLPEPMWRTVEGNPMAIEVNLAADPKLPFRGAEIAWRWGVQTGWVLVECKDNALYVAGKKVEHHLEPEQAAGSPLAGYVLFARLEAKMAGVVLHPNIKSAMMENQHLFPESWKVDSRGRTLHTYLPAVGWRFGANQFIEEIFTDDGKVWTEDCTDLLCDWCIHHPVAIMG